QEHARLRRSVSSRVDTQGTRPCITENLSGDLMHLNKKEAPMTITPTEALSRCIEHREIFHDEMLHLMRMLMRGEMSPTIASALLMGLQVKKETVGEITAAAQVMREFAVPVHIPNTQDLLDMCGTGGDGSDILNMSTTAI